MSHLDKLREEAKLKDIDLDLLITQALEKMELMLQKGFSKEAELIAKQLLVVHPNCLQALQLYGLILFKEKKYPESIEKLKQAIELDPNNSENYNNIALSYLHSHKNLEAIGAIKKALNVKPENVNYINNLALIQRANNCLDQAIETYKSSLDVDSNNARTWESLGSCYGQKKDLESATKCFLKSLEIDPNNLGSHVDLAYAYHLAGNWDAAWPEYEYRLEYWHKEGRNPGKFYDNYPPDKKWNGKDSLEGKKIVVYCEQGTGDMIQFVRFVPKLKELGAIVMIDAPESLAILFNEFGNIRSSYSKEPYDYHCSILSLPFLFNIKVEDFQKEKPYFHITGNMNMEDYKDYLKIGIVWAGNPGHPNDANRSCHLSNFREISKIPNVKLFSLQKEISKRIYTANPDKEVDFTNDCGDIPLIDMSEYMVDYSATAQIIQGMDLIITVDTSVLHLAGALGKETWGLISYNPDWRWTLDGEDNVWYSSVRLFRQDKPNDWGHVFEKVIKKLKDKHENLLQN